MCGRYAIQTGLADLCTKLSAQTALHSAPHSDGATPGGAWPIVIKNRIGCAQWGFPVFGDGRPMINICSESVHHKPSFAESWHRNRRCLVPANAFFEWQGKGKGAQKYRLSYPDYPLFVMAGLWSMVEEKPCFGILTRAATGAAAEIHPRHPCVMSIEEGQAWLGEQEGEAQKNLLFSRDWQVETEGESPNRLI